MACPSTMFTNMPRAASGTRVSVSSTSKVEAKPQRQHQPLHRLLAVGRRGRVCQIPEPAWLVSFSRLTASFTPWADACPTQLAASSLTRLNTTRSATAGLQSRRLTPTHVNNMACGVLTDAGTPYIYCVGGSQVTNPSIADRVFRYDPVADSISAVAAPWPAVKEWFCPVASQSSTTSSISWVDSTPSRTGGKGPTRSGSLLLAGRLGAEEHSPDSSAWLHTHDDHREPRLHRWRGDITAGALTDTTNSFVYDPVADSITTITPIPEPQATPGRLTSAARCMFGRGLTAPNPLTRWRSTIRSLIRGRWVLPFANCRA